MNKIDESVTGELNDDLNKIKFITEVRVNVGEKYNKFHKDARQVNMQIWDMYNDYNVTD